MTDSSGNNVIYEELLDENGKVKFLFGALDGLDYATRITVYGTVYLCFVETMVGDNDYVSSCITLIEDKSDTQDKTVLLDAVNATGIKVDGKERNVNH